ncbi:phage major capsid protein [Bacillus cereus group sp. N6]|uniref:phage major capsid protein n=1 Tax=Bacillus cereus group sp. N6 TaxID=2794583 RepID=UPI0018F68A62|nr:phage major capsid protein [Bacillus cereus group sp. N6]MBJ8113486.1 phage major capsid protein [Bacillus cereus group sp. N6]
MALQDNETKAFNQKKLAKVLANGSEKEVNEAMVEFANNIQQQIIQNATHDHTVLTSRGGHTLTSQETKFYNAVINKGSFAGVEELVPATIVERVFEDLQQQHELLNEIEFVNVNGLSEWIVKKDGVNPAFWGKLCSEIQEKMDNGFETINVNQLKLSAFLPVCNAMLDLGPMWLDRYVRTVLVEALAIALEEAIIAGTGVNEAKKEYYPIGMLKEIDPETGVIKDKAKEPLKTLTPEALGEIMAKLSVLKDDKGNTYTRTPQNVLLIVNPLDYWKKVFPSTTFLNAQGAYMQNVLPIPAKVIQSNAVPQNTMIVGMAKNYFMGLGGAQRIDVYDQTRAIEDETLYIAKMYANGRPKDNQSFLVFDITDLKPTNPWCCDNTPTTAR